MRARGDIPSPSCVDHIIVAELIGEEIYDEFDPQGHPDLSSYAAAEAKAVPTLKRTGSAPQLAALVSGAGEGTAITPAAVQKTIAAPSIVKPMALPALKALNFKGFQRSRSAPPLPHDADGASEKQTTQDGAPPPPSVPEGVEAPLTDSANNAKAMETPGLLPRAAIVPQVVVSDEMLANPPARAPVPVRPVPLSVVSNAVTPLSDGVLSPSTLARIRPGQTSLVVPIAGGGGIPVPVHSPPSRSASPAPSLEQAILVERKRRAQSASGSQSGIKGGWFKSSPLNTGEGVREGVIVAERVKRDLQVGAARMGRDGSGEAPGAPQVLDPSGRGPADVGELRKADENPQLVDREG